jgi:hypothetical protein
LIQDDVLFALSSDSTIDLSTISNVSFQFGTDLSLPNLAGEAGDVPPEPAPLVPEPASLCVWGLGMIGVGIGALRRWQKQ